MALEVFIAISNSPTVLVQLSCPTCYWAVLTVVWTFYDHKPANNTSMVTPPLTCVIWMKTLRFAYIILWLLFQRVLPTEKETKSCYLKMNAQHSQANLCQCHYRGYLFVMFSVNDIMMVVFVITCNTMPKLLSVPGTLKSWSNQFRVLVVDAIIIEKSHLVLQPDLRPCTIFRHNILSSFCFIIFW